MKVALIGATDFVGSALLKEALDPGHLVTAIIRHPENLDKHEGLIDSPQFTPDENTVPGIRRALDASVRSIEHGHLADEPTVKLIGEKGAWLRQPIGLMSLNSCPSKSTAVRGCSGRRELQRMGVRCNISG